MNKKAKFIRKKFNELATILVEHIGFHEITFVFSFEDDGNMQGYDAKLKSADYTHMQASAIIVLEDWEGKMLDDPDGFARLVMHEMLHYAT